VIPVWHSLVWARVVFSDLVAVWEFLCLSEQLYVMTVCLPLQVSYLSD
jgi:hypothetical protein